MREILIFRTDRVGDLLFSLIFIKIIKKNFPNCRITLVTSLKNHEYANTFKGIDKIIPLKNNIFSKINLIIKIRKNIYDAIIVHDGKNRSKFISFFLKSKKRVVCVTDLINTQIDIIKKTCQELQLKYDDSCLNFLDQRDYSNTKIPFNKYIQLHFDEKWIHNKYISKYTNIEPTKEDLINFIKDLILKDKNIIITTGKNGSNLLSEIKNDLDSDKVKIFQNQSLLEIENIVFNSDLLVTCHGWITHIAGAKNIKQIDIIDSSYPYHTWTSHLRNYNYVNRKKFKILASEILSLI